jgi:hypothetical protein
MVNVKLVNYRDDKELDLGLFDYAQLTYDVLRVERDGKVKEIAHYNGDYWLHRDRGVWTDVMIS